MSIYLGVKFRDSGALYYYTSGPQTANVGDHVVVEVDKGVALATVARTMDEPPQLGHGAAQLTTSSQQGGRDSRSREDHGPDPVQQGLEKGEFASIVRMATPEDLHNATANRDLALDARVVCRELVREHKLQMKVVDVEVFLDRSKIVFYFTAPGRVDFRALVKDLVKRFKTRIELRQIGVRHETQMVGAIGNCGLTCCCRQFLRTFEPVTIKMAKEQNLFLNPAKISGICGRLLCCLGYENDQYEAFNRQCPKVGKKFDTGMGRVKVVRTNLFRESITVLPEVDRSRGAAERPEFVELTLGEWERVKSGEPLPERLAMQPEAAPEPLAASEAPARRFAQGTPSNSSGKSDADGSAQSTASEAKSAKSTSGKSPADSSASGKPPAGKKRRGGTRKPRKPKVADSADVAGDAGSKPKPPKKRRRPRRGKKKPSGANSGGNSGANSGNTSGGA